MISVVQTWFLVLKLFVNDWLEHQNDYDAGTDLADVYIKELKEAQQPKKNKVFYTNTEYKINDIE